MSAEAKSAAGARSVVPLEKLPGIPALVRGLAAGAPEVAEFLPDRPDLATIGARARLVLERFHARTAPAALGMEPAAVGRSAVVFTGQQVGLFTGPLLALVKAVAALRLADDLAGSGIPTTPAFWCASEDHDLVEVTRFAVPTPEGSRDAGPEAEPLQANRRPVGGLPIDLDVDALLESAVQAVGRKDDDAYAALRQLSTGRTYREAFVATLGWLLQGTRLVPVDAARREDKPDVVPLAVRLVRERADVRELLVERSSRLIARGFPLQVTGDPDALPLFVIERGERFLLRAAGERLSLKGDPEERTFSADEVVEALESGRFLPSFSALSRPVAVSTLYPVAAQVLGPAEIAYWAQALPLFEWAGVVPPVLVPRPMAAIVEPSVRRLLSKLSLDLEDVLAGPEAILKERGAEEVAGLLSRVTDVRRQALARLEALRPELLAVDEGLGRAVDATREKLEFALAKLEEKTASAAGRSHETLAKQVARVAAALAPGGALAERVFTPVPYLMTLGREGLVAPLLRELAWDTPGLQVIEA